MVELTSEISDALYNESQWIIGITIKIYAMAQMNAISSSSETTTAHGIHTVAKEQLSLIQPMILSKLKSKNLLSVGSFYITDKY